MNECDSGKNILLVDMNWDKMCEYRMCAKYSWTDYESEWNEIRVLNNIMNELQVIYVERMNGSKMKGKTKEVWLDEINGVLKK